MKDYRKSDQYFIKL